MFKFQTLKVWQKAIKYSDKLVNIAIKLPNIYRYTFGTQLINCALSISNNIAEGSGRKSKKESRNFYNIAKGSAYETVNILIILVMRGLYSKEYFNECYREAEEICRMLTGLMKD